jgi:surface protein
MDYMFYEAKNFNQNISSWDISNVINMVSMFYGTREFNQNISNWNLENIEDLNEIFEEAKAFIKKYNSDKPLPEDTKEIKNWFNLNRDKMNAIEIKDKYGKNIDDFFKDIEDKNFTRRY